MLIVIENIFVMWCRDIFVMWCRDIFVIEIYLLFSVDIYIYIKIEYWGVRDRFRIYLVEKYNYVEYWDFGGRFGNKSLRFGCYEILGRLRVKWK